MTVFYEISIPRTLNYSRSVIRKSRKVNSFNIKKTD